MITNARAREIAAFWQSPGAEGIGMAQFASTGTVSDALLDDMDREIIALDAVLLGRPVGERATEARESLAELRALRSHVFGLTAPVWTVGSNVAGYLPEGDVHAFMSYADAVGAYMDAVLDAPENLCGDECECDSVEGDSCDLCSMDALVKGYVLDEVPSVVAGRVFGDERELSIALGPDALPLPTVFWLVQSERLVSDYVAEQA